MSLVDSPARASAARLNRRWHIDSEGFKVERLKAGLTRERAADLLGVTGKTLRNWEAGRTSIPYSAFKLLRILGGYALPGPAWEGFYLRGDTIWSPEGKAFQSYDLAWWGLTVAMARSFRDRQQSLRLQAVASQSVPESTDAPPCAADRREATLMPVEANRPPLQNRFSVGVPHGSPRLPATAGGTRPAGGSALAGRRSVTQGGISSELPPSSNTGGKSNHLPI